MNEVPLVVGVKQSAGDLKLFADLMMMAPDKLIYSAVDALMYPSYALGAHGSIAAILSAAPHASVELWNAVKAGDHARALELHKKLLTLWNAIVSDNLPACTRHAQSLQGLPCDVLARANAGGLAGAAGRDWKSAGGTGRIGRPARRGRGIIPPRENVSRTSQQAA